MERPKTNHNHLQPPQEIQQPPTTTSKTFTTNYNRIPSILKVALYSFYGARGIGTNGASYSKRIFILMRSLKTRVFECSKNASWAGSRGWIFFYNWHVDRLSLSPVVRKNHQIMSYASKAKIDFIVSCQLKLPGCLLYFPWNKENSSCRNVEIPSRSRVGSKNKPSISISSCHSNNNWVPKESSLCGPMLYIGFYYWPSTECYVINICQWEKYLCRRDIQTFVK